MQHTMWGERGKVDGKDTVALLSDERRNLGVFPMNFHEDKRGFHEVTVLGQPWAITVSDNEVLATCPAGTYRAVSEKKFGASKSVEITTPQGRAIRAICEARSDWVYVTGDATEEKLGQFSGAGNGVRSAITEFEPGADLSDEDRVFLSIITRVVLEEKLDLTWLSLVGTLTLILLFAVVALF